MRWRRRRALLLAGVVILCLFVSIAIGFAAGMRIERTAPSVSPEIEPSGVHGAGEETSGEAPPELQ
jgi:hypothetical protein